MINLNLVNRTGNIVLDQEGCFDSDRIFADLEMDHILDAMTRGDAVIETVCKAALTSPLTDMGDLEFRRTNLKDARNNPDAVRSLYDVTMSLEPIRKAAWQPYSNMAIITVYRQAHEILSTYVKTLQLLRVTAEKVGPCFKSDGFHKLCQRLKEEITPEFMSELRRQINEMANPDKLLVGAELGSRLEGVNFTMLENRDSWLQWKFAPSYKVNMSGANATMGDELADINNRKERVLRDTANTLCRALKYLESFFDSLRAELSFYIGCLNLEETLNQIGMPMCLPDITPVENNDRSWSGLYDCALALLTGKKVVGNEFSASDKRIYIVTGANQGGKSTFLRSIGQAQMMAQCGMQIAADSAVIPLRNGLFTHFKREEDRTMSSGKLDEELVRLSLLVKQMQSGSMLLMNESFSSTNEREGSEICRQITLALADSGVEVFSVTHLFIYATSFKDLPYVQFLRAIRNEDASRSFKLEDGVPLETAFGSDLYDKIMKY